MQIYLINSYAQLALVDRRFRRRNLEVTAPAVCITDTVTDNNIWVPFSLNVFLRTLGQFISLHDSPIFMKSCTGMHCIHVLTFTEGISIWFLKCLQKNAFDIRILRKIYL